MTESDPLVFVVDDDDSVRRALARLLRCAGHCVETFASANEFLATANFGARPGCLVLDIELPDINGLQLQRELGASLPIIFISGYGDIPMTVQAMKAGACDFLPKPVHEADLLRAVDQALEHARRIFANRCELDSLRQRVERLTPREREVMSLVVTGRLNKQVASDLGTAEKTIKAHRARVMAKMEVSSLAQLVHLVDRVAISSPADHRSPR
ncbi:response regulator transcription factor [Paraburkholderia phenazinium]|uniref:Two-component response regulator, FixJ family, consists of REC and HTH domains n=1 Tax=Paraburkholderia phenazinium TaxID=60549 RepID=A0A1G8LJ66_9BURK|nr:response regulator [Paraburkholderia phenazinium]SDI55716.1 Two-component response regulator, FixJ family, consists of REC and HTH domains [Paraburkholderia phenazinium]